MRSLLAAALLIGCAPPLQSGDYAIIGGTPTTDFEPVVSVWWVGGFLCSGVLTDPRTVLTAGHCLYGLPPDDPGLTVRFGPQAPTPDLELSASAYGPHPDYAANVAVDVGRITLVEDAPVQAASWNRDALGDELVGESLQIVGYGETIAGEADPDRFRRVATVEVDEVTARQLKWYDDDGNLCEGDSGGAAFLDGELVGVLVEGDTFCLDWGAALRVDSVAAWMDGEVTGDDDDDFALPADDDDAIPPAQCQGCSSVPGAPLLSALLLLRRRKRTAPTATSQA